MKKLTNKFIFFYYWTSIIIQIKCKLNKKEKLKMNTENKLKVVQTGKESYQTVKNTLTCIKIRTTFLGKKKMNLSH